MALIVEDGTRVAGANTYVDISYSEDYFEARGDTVWAGLSLEDKEFALIKAADYIESRFAYEFIGYMVDRDQAMQWPRQDAVLPDGWWVQSDEIPKRLKDAQCEYALQAAISGELIDQGATEASSSPKVAETVKVGPITVSERFKDSTANSRVVNSSVVSASSIKEYPKADLMLQPLLENASSNDLIRG